MGRGNFACGCLTVATKERGVPTKRGIGNLGVAILERGRTSGPRRNSSGVGKGSDIRGADRETISEPQRKKVTGGCQNSYLSSAKKGSINVVVASEDRYPACQ